MVKKYSNIRPTMFRALTNILEGEEEYNKKIIETGIVPPTEVLSGSGEEHGTPPIRGSAWSLDYEYCTKDLYAPETVYAILRKKINIECKDGKMEITDPKGCDIVDNEEEGIFVLCTKPIKIDSAEGIAGSLPSYPKGKRFDKKK